MVGDDLGNHAGGDHGVERQRIILQHPWNVFADRFHGTGEIIDGLLVCLCALSRRDHHAGGAHIHRAAGKRTHRGETRRRNADDDRNFRALDDALDDRTAFSRFQLRRFAHDAQNGDAGAAAFLVKIRQAIDRVEVDRAIVMKRRGGNRIDALGPSAECHVFLPDAISIKAAAFNLNF
ncbi:hypothetical protein D3C73_1099440 [compost metagenome]